MTDVDPDDEARRRAAFLRGAPRIPDKFVWILIGCVAVLGLGGVLLEKGLSAIGLNPTAAPTNSTTATTSSPPTTIDPVNAADVAGGDSALMGLTALAPAPAPGISLYDSAGRALTLGTYSGRVVVVTFFDATCDDICPVMGEEISQADAELGPEAADVEFLTVNTDPLAVGARTPAATFGDHTAPSNWVFASGSLEQMNNVWDAYGVSVDVDTTDKRVSHNDLMYFIDRQGQWRYRATPFANESSTGSYTLPAAQVTAWAHGIAAVAQGLLG